MNIIYKILFVSTMSMSLVLARTSGNFESFSESFFKKAQDHKKALIVDEERSNNEGSLKWKRRHKRRKKAPNRRPKRGK